jgi:hypothetical protein
VQLLGDLVVLGDRLLELDTDLGQARLGLS